MKKIGGRILIFIQLAIAIAAYGSRVPETTLIDDSLAGFEIGNGRSWIENVYGNYRFALFGDWEVGFNKAFTEAIAPLNEGTPRRRIEVNVEKNEDINTYSEFLKYWSEQGKWIEIKLDNFKGIKRIYKKSGQDMAEVRFFRKPKEEIVVQLPTSMLVLLKSFETVENE